MTEHVADAIRQQTAKLDEDFKEIWKKMDSKSVAMVPAPKDMWCVVGELCWKVWGLIHDGDIQGRVMYGNRLWVNTPELVGTKQECKRYLREMRKLYKRRMRRKKENAKV